ncbi:STAS domain-containing protein [Rossellomorea aquimaris]|uniref:STAS domain-containing protein n=1 Tax=Rossellomorea aquimaris TaxID=189382 RepID=UPI001CD72DB2|nr:STAS domain-containing protein [Rossellomorea aquimaris]MCA1055821.1 STAS domain-containing protein [Rossellomorea aquimaris]
MNTTYLELYDYILTSADELTNEWIQTKEASAGSIYSHDVPAPIEEKLRAQNRKFIMSIAQSFKHHDEKKYEAIKLWSTEVAKDRVMTNTSLNEIISQFKLFRRIYWNKINDFIQMNSDSISPALMLEWSNQYNYAFDTVIEEFVKTYSDFHQATLNAQQEVIMELSSPVIKLDKSIAVLPLIGNIDTYRARSLMESSLGQCQEKGVEYLVIDMSGVAIVDTMVANQLFLSISALDLIGVRSIITGMRPEVAQTAIQLGIDFSNIDVYSNLESALEGIKVVN